MSLSESEQMELERLTERFGEKESSWLDIVESSRFSSIYGSRNIVVRTIYHPELAADDESHDYLGKINGDCIGDDRPGMREEIVGTTEEYNRYRDLLEKKETEK